MKLVCASCKAIIYAECPHCQRHLQRTTHNGHEIWVCESPLSIINFKLIDQIEAIQGLCPDCLQLQRQALRELKAEIDGNQANLEQQTTKTRVAT